MHIFHLQALNSYSVSVYETEVLFCVKFLASLGIVMLVWSLPRKSRKRLAHGVICIHVCYTCRSCSWFHRLQLPDTKWQLSRPFLLNIQLTVSDELDRKSTTTKNKHLLLASFIPFLLVGLIMLIRLGSTLNTRDWNL